MGDSALTPKNQVAWLDWYLACPLSGYHHSYTGSHTGSSIRAGSSGKVRASCSARSPAAAAFFICSVLDCSSCVFNTMFCRQHDVLSWVLWMPIDRLKMLDSDPHMQCC